MNGSVKKFTSICLVVFNKGVASNGSVKKFTSVYLVVFDKGVASNEWIS